MGYIRGVKLILDFFRFPLYEISAYPYSSLYQDMKDAVNNSERRSDKKSGRDETGELSLK